MGIPCEKCGEILRAEGYIGHTCKDKLKPCPFCGDSEIEIIRENTHRHSAIIACQNCRCKLEANNNAKDAWNRRA